MNGVRSFDECSADTLPFSAAIPVSLENLAASILATREDGARVETLSDLPREDFFGSSSGANVVELSCPLADVEGELEVSIITLSTVVGRGEVTPLLPECDNIDSARTGWDKSILEFDVDWEKESERCANGGNPPRPEPEPLKCLAPPVDGRDSGLSTGDGDTGCGTPEPVPESDRESWRFLSGGPEPQVIRTSE